MSQKEDLPKVEVCYRVLIGVLLYREREVLGISRRSLSAHIERDFKSLGSFRIQPTVIERIENGVGACHTEHVMAICGALRKIGKGDTNHRIRAYADKITPGAIFSEADRHVRHIELAGLVVVPNSGFYASVADVDKESLKDAEREIRQMSLHSVCTSPWLWEFHGPKANYFFRKSFEWADEKSDKEFDDATAKLERHELAMKEAMLAMASLGQDDDGLENLFTKTRKDLVSLRQNPELDKEEVVDIFRTFATKSHEEALEHLGAIDRQVFEAIKAVAQYRFGMRSSPIPDFADVPDWMREGLKDASSFPPMTPLD